MYFTRFDFKLFCVVLLNVFTLPADRLEHVSGFVFTLKPKKEYIPRKFNAT